MNNPDESIQRNVPHCSSLFCLTIRIFWSPYTKKKSEAVHFVLVRRKKQAKLHKNKLDDHKALCSKSDFT